VSGIEDLGADELVPAQAQAEESKEHDHRSEHHELDGETAAL
jgi:hypothetical protein